MKLKAIFVSKKIYVKEPSHSKNKGGGFVGMESEELKVKVGW